ncbi:DUF3500 domain-containing protein [Mucilaginibacter sp. BJC16-A38]|uniref:DUF3500 domain-containing protein n=1 Tax=Mucilaginibacter phenanthrenivorans TaxID=1234842 RepID=UPI0021574671|nr:DUF3500 domain-containing protein [Mucilaginibacter phenanthrenivorans]MCR8558784.1 DUF3500 domain-containing protein [Mucilaginibacter phenanthrenivorans]
MKKLILLSGTTLLIGICILVACKKSSKTDGTTTASVSALTCGSAVVSSTATVDVAFSGSATVPYTGGNGAAYSAGTAISSTGVTGLTATLAAGTLASGAGSLTYAIAGTATSTGTAAFSITFGGQTCSFSVTVGTASTSTGCSTSTTVASKVTCLANAFLATLTTTQQASVVLTLNLANAERWSNLPCGLSCRNGLAFSSLTSTQLTAAKAVAQAAFGTTTGEGYDEFTQIMAADDYLGQTASGYSSGNYVIAFLGTPSTTGKWMLQIGGHHYAQNITYDAGVVTSITPLHQGVEPKGSFTLNGTTYSGPMESEHTAMQNMLGSFTSTELASAKISSSFSDCLMIPGSTTNTFPTTKQGIKVSTLSTAAQAKVLAAMMPWINDLDATSAAAFTTIYQNELASTYVCYASNTSAVAGTASSFLTTNTDYVRIDGPSVWIEFICQTGVVLSGIHYHSVMRDHSRDYIGL